MIHDKESTKIWLCAACLWFVAQVFGTQALWAQTSILNTNLIVNGGAEAGPAGTSLSTIVTSIPGWTATARTNVLSYDISGLLQSTDPAPPDHGFKYFVSAPGTTSTLTQDIDVSSGASVIAAGNIRFTVSAYLGSVKGAGLAAPAQMAAAFKNASGQTFSTATLGPLGLPAQGMSMQQAIGPVPAGTVTITVTLTLITHCENAAACSNGAADSLSLVFSTFGTSPRSVLGTNLVVNGGAEAGPGLPASSTALYVPGWSTGQGASVAPYGGAGWITVTDPGPADRGVNLFCGGFRGANSYQDLDVSAAAAPIDAGQVTYKVSAWLGGLGGVQFSSPSLTYIFYDWLDTQLAPTGNLGPLSHPGTALLETFSSGTIPRGTRRVHIALTFPGADYLADDINFTLDAPAGPPVIDPGGIISAGSFGGFSSIAPGSWIEIYGTNLASATQNWSGADFENGVAPAKLDDVSVSVGGQAAFIDYISPGQINALVPSDAPTGSVEITLTNSNGTSEGFPIYLKQVEPGLLAPSNFIVNKKQYVAALHSDGSYALPANAVAGVASRPAMVGETVTMYGVGFGPVTEGFTAGTVVTAENSLTTLPQFLFGTTPATLSYDGLALSLTGLYQFNVVVPKVNTNSAMPFSIDVGGVKGSQTLYMAVQN